MNSTHLNSSAAQITATLRRTQPLPSPALLRERLPVDHSLALQIEQQQRTVAAIMAGTDPRLMVVVGPCSIHDPQAALEYAHQLAELAEQLADQLFLVMRCYVEKPRTTVGWKGLLYDPHLDGSDDIATGLTVSRHLMRDIAKLGLPLATELLHPFAADYLADLLSWAAIGARTTESQIHRESVSGLPLAVGFKNGTDGGITVATDAMAAAAHPHSHLGMDEHGRVALINTPGNANTHLVLRGGRAGPNYQADHIDKALSQLQGKGLNPQLMVDCSHANSGKDPQRQPQVCEDVVAQRAAGNRHISALMLESHLHGGSQPLCKPLRHGVSITDACLGMDETRQLLVKIAEKEAENRI